MTALLGLLALAGYQNRDKLADLFMAQAASPSASMVAGRAVACVISIR